MPFQIKAYAITFTICKIVLVLFHMHYNSKYHKKEPESIRIRVLQSTLNNTDYLKIIPANSDKYTRQFVQV